jgi:hypothetical protein
MVIFVFFFFFLVYYLFLLGSTIPTDIEIIGTSETLDIVHISLDSDTATSPSTGILIIPFFMSDPVPISVSVSSITNIEIYA